MPRNTQSKSSLVWNFLLDAVFPPAPEEVEIRSLSPAQFMSKVGPAPATHHPYLDTLLPYKNPLVSELIWQIKSKRNRHAFEIGAYILHEKLIKIVSNPCLLVPVPISKQRRKERGYNQCELLITGIIELDTDKIFIKNFSILTRTKHIKTKQAFKNREERLASSHALFSAIKTDNVNTPIIIIDDVVTTGSTAKEARNALLDAGYSNVRILALSH